MVRLLHPIEKLIVKDSDGKVALLVDFENLVHVFGKRQASRFKNAVDVKMAVDAVEAIWTLPHVATFVIVSGDRDFIHVLKTLRRYGKTVVGVSPDQSVSEDFAALCDRFVRYGALCTSYAPEGAPSAAPVAVPAAEGQGAARRFRAVPVAVPEAGEVVPLSPEARALRAYLRQPVAARVPVGYRREFLEGYRPDRDFLLPASLREKLARLGHTEGTRPAGTYAREILDRLLVDLSWASSRLEGNTYTLLDTRRLIEEGTRAEGRSAEEALMILSHKRAIELLVERADDLGFSAMLVRNLHACLAEGLVADPAAAGALRTGAVYIERSAYLPPQLPQVVEEMFALFLARASAITDPFEQSFFALVHIPYLQPFADVNKRTARLTANIPLVRENLCPLSFVDVTERDYVEAVLGVYERLDTSILRDLYEWAYERSSARYRAVRDSLGRPDPFRVRYRQELARAVKAVVLGEAADAQQAITITDPDRALPPPDRERLCTLVETELSALHEGDFARFGLTPDQFLAWQDREGKAS